MTTQQETGSLGLDDPWLAEPRKRSRLRLVLVVLLGAALVFYAGVAVQQRYGAATGTDAATGPLAGGFTPPDGAAFPGGGQLPADGTGTDSTDGATSVIGTVVSLKDDKLVVEDFGGTKHTITLGVDVRVVLETAGSSDDVTRGSTVQVSGQADDQDQITATTITVR